MSMDNKKMICPVCKKELPEDSEFCQYCGNKIASSDDNPIIPETASSEEKGGSTSDNCKNEIAVDSAVDMTYSNELDDDFGLTPDKPIYTVGIEEQKKYLQKLRTDKGKKIKYVRRGSILINGIEGAVDVYEIYLQSGKWYKTIYMNMYGKHNAMFAPKGFSLPLMKKSKEKKKRKPFKKHQIVIGVAVLVCLIVGALFASVAIHRHNLYTDLYTDLCQQMKNITSSSNLDNVSELIERLPTDYKNVEEIKLQYAKFENKISIINSLTKNNIRSNEKSETLRKTYEDLYELDKQYDNWNLNYYLKNILHNTATAVDFYFGKKWELSGYYYFHWYEDGNKEIINTNLPNKLDDNKEYTHYLASESGYTRDNNLVFLNETEYIHYRNIQNYDDTVEAYQIVSISYNGEWQIKISCYSNSKEYTLN